MARLLLAKHSAPEITPAVISHRWVLSGHGRARSLWLADEWRCPGVQKVYASLEPKALETAALVAAELGVGVHPQHGLEENDRTGLGHLPADELRQTIGRFFQQPDQLIIGRETAASARARFESAVREIAAHASEADVGVVAHGTVITLLVAAHNAVEPMALWSQLETPSYLALDAAAFRWDGVVHRPPVNYGDSALITSPVTRMASRVAVISALSP